MILDRVLDQRALAFGLVASQALLLLVLGSCNASPAVVEIQIDQAVLDLEYEKLVRSASIEAGAALPPSDSDPVLLVRQKGISWLVSTSTLAEEEACHACSGATHVTLIGTDADVASVLRGSQNILPGGGNGWGQPASVSIRTDLLAGPALMLESGFTAQGKTTSDVTIYELTQRGAIHRATLQTGCSNDSGLDVSGTIVAGQQGRSFELKLAGDPPVSYGYRFNGVTFEPSFQSGRAPAQGASDSSGKLPLC